MKTLIILAAAASVFFAVAPTTAQVVVREQPTTTVTTIQPTEAIGTVAELLPDTITVRTEEAPAPVRYSFTKTTEYVDEAGNRVTRDVVKTGVPVTIRYIKEGDRMLVNRVIVRKVAAPAPDTVVTKKTTTTTTTTKEKD